MIDRIKLIIATLFIAFVTCSHAIPILAPVNGTHFTTVGNSSLTDEEVAAAIGVNAATLTLVYKVEADGAESESAADYYETVFSPLIDPKGATITHDTDDPVISGPSIYLVAKDGDAGHYWWNISGWNGLETLTISGLYPNGGSISHLRIYTGSQTSVPDGGLTAGLLGLSLLALRALRSRFHRS